MWYQRKGSKYGAKSTEYNGEVYHSKKEAGRAAELDLLVKGGAIRGWKRQVRISFDICSKCHRLCSERCDFCKKGKGRSLPPPKIYHLTNYYIDFVLEENDGTETYEEVKGFETAEWRQKWKLLTILYEDDETKKLVVTK
jgi:Protein of unknown function (DUF1064)